MKRRMTYLIAGLCVVLYACNGDDVNEENSEADNGDVEGNGETAEAGGELQIAYSAQPPLLDVHETTSIASSDIMRHVFEPLVTVDSEYNIQPMLAESYEQSEDGSEIVFNLREGIQFHNGEEMTAEDVVASMEKWIESPGSRGQLNEATFEETDEYTVTLHVEEDLATALPLMAFNANGFPAIMPTEIVEQAESGGVTEYIGTGPFQFEEWVEDQYVHISKFDDYQMLDEPAEGLSGKREALVDDIFYEFVTDSSTRVSGIQTGEYDIAHSIPYDNVDMLNQDDSLENHIYTNGALVSHFNKREGFFVDQDAREALALSLDMESIMQAAYPGEDFYILTHNMMMSYQESLWGSDAGADKYNVNEPEYMTEYLDEIGYDGEEITILTTRDYESHYNGAVVIQQQMEEMGMNVNLEVYDWATSVDLRDDENAYDFFVTGNTPFPEPSSNVHFDPEFAGWAEVPEDLLDEFRQQPTLEDSVEIYDDLQEWYWDYIPVLKIGDYNSVSTTRDSVDGFLYQDGFVLWNVSIED